MSGGDAARGRAEPEGRPTGLRGGRPTGSGAVNPVELQGKDRGEGPGDLGEGVRGCSDEGPAWLAGCVDAEVLGCH